jgi:hypothetical protein
MRRALLLTTLAIVAAGCGKSATYDTDEVVAAFKRHGLTLRNGYPFGSTREIVDAHDGDLLIPTPRSRAEFIVLVISNAAADDAWRDYEPQQTPDSFDARRANVMVISDSGLSTSQRRRVLGALSSLASKGAPLMVAGRK